MQKLMEYYEEQQKKLFKRSIAVWILLTGFMTWLGIIIRVNVPNVFTKLANSTSYSWLSSLLTSSDTQIFVQNVLNWLFALATPTAIVVIAYFHKLKTIETKTWKQKYPEYDISGEWLDTTEYRQSLDSNGWDGVQTRGESTVIFKQTCKELKIPPCDGDDFSWRAIVVYWDNQDELHILYKVQYKGVKPQHGYPESRIGYEMMHIDRTGLSEKQKPHKMCGKFWHCIAPDGKPMYLGDVIYER